MQYLLGIDITDKGLEMGLFDEPGNLISCTEQKVDSHKPAIEPGGFDPELWWKACIAGIQQIVEESKIEPADIAVIGFSSSQRFPIYMDAEGKAVRPFIIKGNSFAELQQWIRDKEPKTLNKATWLLLPKDFLRFKFSGQAHADFSGASAMNLLDNTTLKWSAKKAQEMGVELEKLPTLKASHHVVGVITPEAAEETGLAMGTMVGAGAISAASALFGMGLVNSGDMGVIDPAQAYRVLAGPIPEEKNKSDLYHHAVPNKWIQFIPNPTNPTNPIPPRASVYGAALLAGVAGGTYLSIEECLKNYIRPGKRIEPVLP